MWLIIGLVFGAAILGLIWFLSKNNMSLKWYEWVIGIIGLILLLMTIQNFVGSFQEGQPQAAWLFALIVGLPAIIFIALAWVLAARRIKGSEA